MEITVCDNGYFLTPYRGCDPSEWIVAPTFEKLTSILKEVLIIPNKN